MPAPFNATLSDELRASVTPEDIEFLQVITQDAVDRIAGDPEISASLKVFQPGGASLRREIAIKPRGSSDVTLKMFVGWDHASACWHVLIEGGTETAIEKQIVTIGGN